MEISYNILFVALKLLIAFSTRICVVSLKILWAFTNQPCRVKWHAFTTPQARWPGIARNGRRATVFVGRSCPANLCIWKFGQSIFPASNLCSWNASGALDFKWYSTKVILYWSNIHINFCPWFYINCVQLSVSLHYIIILLDPFLNCWWKSANKTALSPLVVIGDDIRL